jgi:hypothetical protein
MRAFTHAVMAALEAALTATGGAIYEVQPIKDLCDFAYKPLSTISTAPAHGPIRALSRIRRHRRGLQGLISNKGGAAFAGARNGRIGKDESGFLFVWGGESKK